MKLSKALEIGRDCGLETVGECIRNIEIHSSSLFSYSDIGKELLELNTDYKALCSCSLVKDGTLVYVAQDLLDR